MEKETKTETEMLTAWLKITWFGICLFEAIYISKFIDAFKVIGVMAGL
jgi:hypothetical protein